MKIIRACMCGVRLLILITQPLMIFIRDSVTLIRGSVIFIKACMKRVQALMIAV